MKKTKYEYDNSALRIVRRIDVVYDCSDFHFPRRLLCNALYEVRFATEQEGLPIRQAGKSRKGKLHFRISQPSYVISTVNYGWKLKPRDWKLYVGEEREFKREGGVKLKGWSVRVWRRDEIK